jgi:hypothetical protein
MNVQKARIVTGKISAPTDKLIFQTVLLAALLSAMLFSGCQNDKIFGYVNATYKNGNSVVPYTPEGPVVSVSPSHQELIPGTQDFLFTATVKYTDGSDYPDQGISWSLDGYTNNKPGTGIIGTGVAGSLSIAADEDAPYLVVRATSTADSTKFGEAVIIINSTVNAYRPALSLSPTSFSYHLNESPLSPVTVTVDNLVTLQAQPGYQSVTYQWYSTDDPTQAPPRTGTPVGTDSDTYTPPPATTSTAGTSYYYVKVTNTIDDNGDGGQKTVSEESGIVTVVVRPKVDVEIPQLIVINPAENQRQN